MAKITLGLAMPRGPQLKLPADQWAALGERDRLNPWLFDLDGKQLSYDELLATAPPSIAAELTPERQEARFQAAQVAMARVRAALAAANPDIVLVMGDDENELFQDDATRPKLAVFRGTRWIWRDETQPYPVPVPLTDHVIEQLHKAGYAVHVIDALRDGERMPHSFGQVYAELMQTVKPIVPIMVNIHYPVNQTTPIESYELGRVVKRAIEAWGGDETVAVVGNGGLSVGVLREDFDRQLLRALQEHDAAAVAALPSRWIKGPSGEIYNWIGAGGVLEDLKMNIVDYLPAYRSPAGTGCGMAFAIWS